MIHSISPPICILAITSIITATCCHKKMVTLTDISCLQQVKNFSTNTHTHTHTHTHNDTHNTCTTTVIKGLNWYTNVMRLWQSVHQYIITHTYTHTHTQMIFIHYTNNNNKNHNKYVERVATNNILKVTGTAFPHLDYLQFLSPQFSS